MPRYDYICRSCGAKEERTVKRTECGNQTCLFCDAPLEIELAALSVAPGLTTQSHIKLKDGRRLAIPHKVGRPSKE